jgi:hypothetical protein
MTYTDQIDASLRLLADNYRSLCQTVIDTARSYEGEWKDKHVAVVIEVLRGIPVPEMKPPADWATYDQEAYRAAYKEARKPNYQEILNEYIEQAKLLKREPINTPSKNSRV